MPLHQFSAACAEKANVHAQTRLLRFEIGKDFTRVVAIDIALCHEWERNTMVEFTELRYSCIVAWFLTSELLDWSLAMR